MMNKEFDTLTKFNLDRGVVSTPVARPTASPFGKQGSTNLYFWGGEM